MVYFHVDYTLIIMSLYYILLSGKPLDNILFLFECLMYILAQLYFHINLKIISQVWGENIPG